MLDPRRSAGGAVEMFRTENRSDPTTQANEIAGAGMGYGMSVASQRTELPPAIVSGYIELGGRVPKWKSSN
jgi:hypothetical protein